MAYHYSNIRRDMSSLIRVRCVKNGTVRKDNRQHTTVLNSARSTFEHLQSRSTLGTEEAAQSRKDKGLILMDLSSR